MALMSAFAEEGLLRSGQHLLDQALALDEPGGRLQRQARTTAMSPPKSRTPATAAYRPAIVMVASAEDYPETDLGEVERDFGLHSPSVGGSGDGGRNGGSPSDNGPRGGAGFDGNVDGSGDENEEDAVPQLIIDPDTGQFVIDPESQVSQAKKDQEKLDLERAAEAERLLAAPVSAVAASAPPATGVFRRERAVAEKWTTEDTDKFFEALRKYGTDFSLIELLFPSRERKQVKLKFKREERTNPDRVAAALRSRLIIDVEEFRVSKAESEEHRRRNRAEQAKKRAAASSKATDGPSGGGEAATGAETGTVEAAGSSSGGSTRKTGRRGKGKSRKGSKAGRGSAAATGVGAQAAAEASRAIDSLDFDRHQEEEELQQAILARRRAVQAEKKKQKKAQPELPPVVALVEAISARRNRETGVVPTPTGLRAPPRPRPRTTRAATAAAAAAAKRTPLSSAVESNRASTNGSTKRKQTSTASPSRKKPKRSGKKK